MNLWAWSQIWLRHGDGAGHGDGSDMLVPTRVDTLRFGGAKIVMVEAGDAHSIAATAEGDVYTWVSGEEGALGLNDAKNRLVPTKLDRTLFGGRGVVMVAAGT